MEKLWSQRLCHGLEEPERSSDRVCSQGVVQVPTGPFWHVCNSPSSPLEGLSSGLQPQSIPQQPGQLILLPLGFGVDPQIE